MIRFWDGLNLRERTLAATVVALAALFSSFVVAQRGMRQLHEAEARIDLLEQELVILHEHLAQSALVEEAFRAVAVDHSTRLTKPEIHDHLRREIYRLAQRRPPEPGTPVLATGRDSSDALVHIPVLREGIMSEEGDGYREYQIAFRIPSATIENIVLFMERIRTSDQLLRVDALELARAPHGRNLSAMLEVTRTVLERPADEDGAEALGNLIRNGSFEVWDHDSDAPQSWTVKGCTVRQTRTGGSVGDVALNVVTKRGKGALFQSRILNTNTEYLLTLDITSDSDADLGVANARQVSLGEQRVIGDGRPYRYALRFHLSGPDGSRRRVLVPYLSINDAGASLTVDNVRLERVGGES
ncbi:MAG: hypothetical protein IIB38_14155 [Candidatus Hydrogenedentes bacterium]|nr:hypothetical protein [Candidatus Hydrogenedentota bacterium]